jgi:CHAT domain-containing protein
MNLTTLAQEPARQGPVVMADPAYDGDRESVQARFQLRGEDRTSGGEKFRRLPGTAKEAEKLQRLLKLDKESVFTGTDATEEKLKALHGPRILHVATHGFFHAGENPMLSTGLALANANQRRSGSNDDGILTAAEAALLDLRGTQLVVLSACETGLGQVQQGEGVYGLRRALGLAGTRTQVVSLWKVADDQTQALMVDYYGRLLQGEGRSAALRAAQQAMLANSATRHPFYWAAFLPIGDWTPLTADKR